MESMAFGIASFGSSTFPYWIESSYRAVLRRAAEFPVFVICASHRYVQSYNRTIYIVSHFPIWIIVIIITRSVYLSISPTTGGNAIFQSASERHHLHVLYATYIFHLGLENAEQWVVGWCVHIFFSFYSSLIPIAPMQIWQSTITITSAAANVSQLVYKFYFLVKFSEAHNESNDETIF